jgi:hypothetical protein
MTLTTLVVFFFGLLSPPRKKKAPAATARSAAPRPTIKKMGDFLLPVSGEPEVGGKLAMVY